MVQCPLSRKVIKTSMQSKMHLLEVEKWKLPNTALD